MPSRRLRGLRLFLLEISLTNTQPTDANACIEFQGARFSSGGYGAVRHEGQTVRAHRLAYCAANGISLASIAGVEVRHSCDNPPCINPAHLLLGSHADNMRDMFERGRRKAAVGEKVWTAKLTPDDVVQIRRANAAGESQRSIAFRIGLNPTTVRKICLRETWRHVE